METIFAYVSNWYYSIAKTGSWRVITLRCDSRRSIRTLNWDEKRMFLKYV